MNINLNVVSFSDLSDDAKKRAKENINDFLNDILECHIEEIKKSKEAYLKAYYDGSLKTLDKNACPLTGVCYDYDFMEIDYTHEDSIENAVNKVFMKLKRDEKIGVFNNESVADLCEGNEIYFLENGIEFQKIKKLLKGLI